MPVPLPSVTCGVTNVPPVPRFTSPNPWFNPRIVGAPDGKRPPPATAPDAPFARAAIGDGGDEAERSAGLHHHSLGAVEFTVVERGGLDLGVVLDEEEALGVADVGDVEVMPHGVLRRPLRDHRPHVRP